MTRLVVAINILSLTALVLSGCGSQAQREVIVTRDDSTLPSGCGPREVAQLIMRFFDAFNNGDQEQLDRFFGFESGFQWYSVTEGDPSKGGRHFVAYNPEDLLAYFAERHQQHERLRLITVDVAGPSWHGGVDIAYFLTRRADDLEPGLEGSERIVHGKGAINCEKQQIFVWSMGMPMVDEKQPSGPLWREIGLCPDPPAGTPPTAVVACARG